MLYLVTGPSRSGKSEWAESLALQSKRLVTYVATASLDSEDQEWCDRIAQHQARRPAEWQTLTASAELAAIVSQASDRDCLLIDSLGTWIAPYLEEADEQWQQRVELLLHALQSCQALVVVVAEETGWGLVPAYPLGRTFRDRLGSLTRAIASLSDRAFLVVAGYAIDLHAVGIPVPPQIYRNTQDLKVGSAD